MRDLYGAHLLRVVGRGLGCREFVALLTASFNLGPAARPVETCVHFSRDGLVVEVSCQRLVMQRVDDVGALFSSRNDVSKTRVAVFVACLLVDRAADALECLVSAVVLLQLDARVFVENLRYFLATREPKEQPCDVRIGRLLDFECMRDGDDAVEDDSWVAAVSLVWLACVLEEET